jgi:hypothetical protein
VEIVCPNDAARHPRLLLAFEVAIADVGEAEQAIASLAKYLGHWATDGAETNKGNPARGSSIAWFASGISARFVGVFLQKVCSRGNVIFIITGTSSLGRGTRTVRMSTD